jgi:iron complex outermembrane recepter protein
MRIHLLLGSVFLAANSPAFAQAAAESETAQDELPTSDEGIGEIIVTAQRRAQALSEVPLAVTAIGGESFESQGFDTLDDLVGTVPSLTFGSSANSRGEGLVIRGFGTTSFSDAAEGAVGIVIDGVTLGRQAAGLLDLIDIERIEVLRGPQGTLFGKNSSAGLINIVTRRPSEELELTARASYGSDDELRLAASVSGPLVADRILARITAFRNKRDGIVNQVNSAFPETKFNNVDQWGVRGKLEFRPSDKLTATLIGEYQKQDILCCNWTRRSFAPPALGALATLERVSLTPFYTPGPANRDVAITIRSNFQRSETKAGTLNIDYQIGDHTLRSITGYRSFDISEGNKADQLPVSFFNLAATDSRIEQVSQELQLVSPDDGPVKYTFGLFYYQLDVDSVQTQAAEFAIAPAPVGAIPAGLAPILFGATGNSFPRVTLTNIQNQSQKTINYAGYGQISYDFTPQFTATLGARLLRESLDVYFDRSGGLPIGAFGQRIVPGIDPDAVKDTALTYTGSLRYELADDISIYGTYARGYKGRAYDLNAGSPIVFVGAQPIFNALQPERVDNYEIGLRSLLLDRRLQVNLTAFNTDVANYQAAAQRTDGVPGFVLNNVGKFRTRGVELELLARPSRAFEFGANLAVIDAEYVDYPNGECPSPFVANRPPSCALTGTQDLSGTQAANAPDISGSAYAQLTLSLSDSWDVIGWGQVNFRSDTLYSLTQDPNTIQDGYATVNTRLTLRSDKGYELSLWARNLTDTDYAEGIFSTPIFTGGYSQFLATDRQIGVEAKLSF